MVIQKIKKFLNKNDEKYELLFYKYSQLKLKNKKLREEKDRLVKTNKDKLKEEFGKELIALFEKFEDIKNNSFKVNATTKELQTLLLSINALEKMFSNVSKNHGIEQYVATERFYDPELHKVASYEDGKGMQKGIILKTVKKGYKYKNMIIRKPRVVVIR